jgi:hypothetical protein
MLGVTTDANKLEHVQRQFAVQSFFPLRIPYNHTCALELLKSNSLQVPRHNKDTGFVN